MRYPTAQIRTLCRAVNVGHVGPSSMHRDPSGIPFLMGKDVGFGVVRTHDLERVTEAFHRSQPKSQLRAGDVIVVRIGKSGQAAKVPKSLGDANCSGLVIIKQPLSIDADFLVYYLNSPLGRANSASEARGSTRLTLNTESVASASVPVPPLEEQRRIVAILDEAFEAIATATANTEKNLQSAREVFEANLQDTLCGAPDGVSSTTLGAVCRFVGGSQPPKSEFVSAPRAGYVRLIQIRDYKSDARAVYIPRALARRFCAPDDVMIGRYGPPLFQILRGLEGAYNVALMKAAPDESVLSKGYLYYFLRHRDILNYVIASSARAAGQIGLNKETIEPYQIYVPCLKTQAETVSRLEQLEAATEALVRTCELKLAALDELKKSLLHQAFTGQLNTKFTEQQVAEVA